MCSQYLASALRLAHLFFSIFSQHSRTKLKNQVHQPPFLPYIGPYHTRGTIPENYDYVIKEIHYKTGIETVLSHSSNPILQELLPTKHLMEKNFPKAHVTVFSLLRLGYYKT